jgi:hypothetical protein
MFANPDPNPLRLCVSPARMALYRGFFAAQTDRESLGALLWHQRVGAALWPLLGIVEVAFRNRTHYALSMLHGGVSSRAWYGAGSNDMRLKLKLQRKFDDLQNLKDEAGQALVKSIDDLISETTFGIWIEALYELPFDRRYRFSKLALPGYPPLGNKGIWGAAHLTWMPLIARLERHKTYRDRVAHHGPLWKISFNAPPGTAARLPNTPQEFMQSLHTEESALRTTAIEMEPGLADFWDGDPRTHFYTLTTSESLDAAMGRAPNTETGN